MRSLPPEVRSSSAYSLRLQSQRSSVLEERGVERLAVGFLGIGDGAVDVEDQAPSSAIAPVRPGRAVLPRNTTIAAPWVCFSLS